MSDFWTDFTDVIKSRVLAQDGFTGEFYVDNVPDDTSKPYAVIPESTMSNWMTFSNVTAGENLQFRIILTNDVRNGGSTVLKAQTEAVIKALHLKFFETTDFEVESCKRTEWSKPFKVQNDSMQWKQYVDFAVRVKYKSGSDYYTDFSL